MIKKIRKRNQMFVEWYKGKGYGYQNCIGKTEEEKLESAFEEGMKVVLACIGLYQKSIKEMLFKKK